jgi:hypothetical protein
MGFSTDSWDLGFQDESILSLDRGGLSTQLHDRPVGREARVACPSSRKEQIFPTHFFLHAHHRHAARQVTFLRFFNMLLEKVVMIWCFNLFF